MNDELKELYQQIILDHNTNPCGYGKLKFITCEAEGYNHLCGDKVNVYIKSMTIMDDNIIEDISFESSGCAISKASTSLMCSIIKGKTVAEAKKIFDEFKKLVYGETLSNDISDEVKKLAVFSGLKNFPSRVKCATLPWHTMIDAIKSG